jgi:hypothetical protein
MSEETNASESPPSPSRCYATEVSDVVTKLIRLAYANRWSNLSLDTDEDCPFVSLWNGRNTVRVYGHRADKPGWIMPPEDETWSFLECCQRALAEAEKLA